MPRFRLTAWLLAKLSPVLSRTTCCLQLQQTFQAAHAVRVSFLKSATTNKLPSAIIALQELHLQSQARSQFDAYPGTIKPSHLHTLTPTPDASGPQTPISYNQLPFPAPGIQAQVPPLPVPQTTLPCRLSTANCATLSTTLGFDSSAKDGTIDIRTEEAQDMIHLYCCDNLHDRQVQPTQPRTDKCNHPSFRRPRLKLTAWHLDGLQLLLDLRLLQVHGHLSAALHELLQDTVRQLRHHLL